MIYNESPAFSRDLKRLTKKWRTLPKDLEAAKRVIASLYTSQESVDAEQFRRNFFDGKTATVLSLANGYEVIKMRLDCSSPGAQSKVRLVFICIITNKEVTLLELFSKSEKDREDEERIKRFIFELSSND